MNWKRAWLALLGKDTPVTKDDVNNAYQLGFQSGAATGEYRGREFVIREIEIALAARGKTLNEAEPEDVAKVKARLLH